MSKFLPELKKLLWSIVGIIILGLSINLLSWKFKIVSGGMPGYALNINYMTGISVGTFLIVLNSVVVFFNFLLLGKGAGLRAIFGYVFLSIFIDFSRQFIGSQIVIDSFVLGSVLMALQGAIAPIGIAIVLANNYTIGSYSSIHPVINKYIQISAPAFFLMMDGILTVITFFSQGWEKAFFLLINSVVFFFIFKYSLPIAKKYYL